MSNGQTGNVQVILQGQSAGGVNGGLNITSSHVTLTSTSGQQLYSGSLTNMSGDRRWYMTALLAGTGSSSGKQIQVQMVVRVDGGGQVTGTITAGSAVPAGSDT
jgi:hypothetical protein